MSLMGNVLETVKSTGSDYWAAYVGGEKIKTDGLKPRFQSQGFNFAAKKWENSTQY